MTNVVPPPKASILAHSANAAPSVVPAQPSTINASRFGSRANAMRSFVTSLSFGRTAVASQRRSFGTKRNVPTMPRATPAMR
ncbi:Uncharacterised protein [Mycobacterium tuberculosis]|nr:Uncharacterised protein [Mycobacterium tuberculosis]